MWMIRAGRGGQHVADFIKNGVDAIGGQELGALSPSMDKDDLLRLHAETYPDQKEGSRASWASQHMRFLREMKVGDTAVTSDPDRRLYFVGAIKSAYEWSPGLVEDKPHVRRVAWTHQVARDVLTVSTRNTFGSSLT